MKAYIANGRIAVPLDESRTLLIDSRYVAIPSIEIVQGEPNNSLRMPGPDCYIRDYLDVAVTELSDEVVQELLQVLSRQTKVKELVQGLHSTSSLLPKVRLKEHLLKSPIVSS